MSIAPKEFLTYINGALDGMVQIVEALGDERVNLRPNNMPNTNSPFAILTHCVGLTRYFIGTALAGRQVHRDRDAEFRAQGTVADIRQVVREIQQHLPDDLTGATAISPVPSLKLCANPTGPGRKGALCSSVTKNWRNTMGTWNSPVMSCWGRGQLARGSRHTCVLMAPVYHDIVR